MHVSVRVPVNIVCHRSLRARRTMREMQVVALKDHLKTVTHEIPAMLGVPLRALLIMVATHKDLFALEILYHMMNIRIVSDANIAEMDQCIFSRNGIETFPKFLLPTAGTTAPFFELHMIKMGI